MLGFLFNRYRKHYKWNKRFKEKGYYYLINRYTKKKKRYYIISFNDYNKIICDENKKYLQRRVVYGR